MKKSLIALAVMAAAGAASAQSSVTLFGIVDATVSHYSVSGGQHNTILTNSGYNSSRLGFRGTEDLGGGMAASFWLEAGLNNDNGSNGTSNTNNTLGGGTGGGGLTFGRRSTVSLSGGWGEVRIGRDYVPTFWNTNLFDPFGTNGVGTTLIQKAKTSTLSPTLVPFANTPAGTLTEVAAQDPNAVRASNMVQYFLPANLGGIYGQASYGFSEVANGGDAGRFVGARVGFGQGPFNVAIAYGRTSGSDAVNATILQTTPDVSDWNVGGQWDFGMARVMAAYDRTKFSNGFGVTPNSTLKGWQIGALVPVGPGEIRASYSREKLDVAGADPRADQWAVGYVHNLSKRTALYATYARIKNKDGAALPISASLPQSTAVLPVINSTSTGFDLGIRHSF
jgi:predicted porin